MISAADFIRKETAISSCSSDPPLEANCERLLMSHDPDSSAPVVVGVDDSPESMRALEWAAEAAVRRGSTLRILHAYRGSPAEAPGSVEPTLAMVDDAAAEVRRAHPELTIEAMVARGWAVPVILRESAAASLVVVGTRVLGPVRDILLGSVSRPVVQMSSCPVVVVRERASRSVPNLRVVVGVDRSSSWEALDFAFEEASLTDCGVTAVHVWPDTPALERRLSSTVDREEHGLAERTWFDDVLRPWRVRYPDVDVVRDVVESDAKTRLLRLSENARLLVVGSRRRGPVSALAMGSVSMAAVQQARCPVAVVSRRPASERQERMAPAGSLRDFRPWP